MVAKLSVTNVFKVFGGSESEVIRLLEAGRSKEEILGQTGATVGVQDASFDVAEGELFVVMGLSGSGKSTLIRMLNGLIPPTSGAILVDGEDVASCRNAALRRIRREKIAMVFQHFALFPHWTVADNVAYGLKIRGIEAEERRSAALKSLEQVGLSAWADSMPTELSGGMQQRVGLARALANDPEILLMDEPFGALDPLIRREMQDELIELQKTLKKTIVFITHDLNEALILGDRIAIMKDGRFVQIGTAQEIASDPADEYVAAFVADIDRGRVFTASDVSEAPRAVQLSDSPGEALRLMEEHNLNAVYVLDGEKIAGVVTYQQVTVLQSNNQRGTLADALITEFPRAECGAQLHDLYGAASAGLPIAVTDEQDRLVGVVASESVLGRLAADETVETAIGRPGAEEERRDA